MKIDWSSVANSIGNMFVVVLFTVTTSLPANTLGLFPAGPAAKSAGMESAVESSEPQGLLYNPAGIADSAPGIHGEFGVGRLLYSYEHPRFDPVKVSLWTPVASAGWRSRSSESLSWGFAIFPSSMAKLEVNGLPRRINGKPESLNVKTSRKQLHAPIGVAWSTDPGHASSTSLGAALITTYDERKLTAESLVDGAKLVDMKSKGVFFRPNVGILTSSANLDFGMSYTHELTKKFKGSTTLVSESFETEQVDYDPASLNAGLKLHCDTFTSSFQVNRIYGAKGASIIRDGINRRTTTADVRDVNHLGMRLGYLYSSDDTFSLAYAYLPTTWGAGSYSVDTDGFSHQELGHLFGTFQAMPTRNQSVAWNHKTPHWVYSASMFRSAGQQTIAGEGDNPGFYQLEFIAVTAGLTKTW
ncbi:MAG: hypothetical protein NTV34_15450 [Proteobacteria bacterium]|nr:hypothetical protein [Pseudomonadota bacterium]